jgi:hypothetical protein
MHASKSGRLWSMDELNAIHDSRRAKTLLNCLALIFVWCSCACVFAASLLSRYKGRQTKGFLLSMVCMYKLRFNPYEQPFTLSMRTVIMFSTPARGRHCLRRVIYTHLTFLIESARPGIFHNTHQRLICYDYRCTKAMMVRGRFAPHAKMSSPIVSD